MTLPPHCDGVTRAAPKRSSFKTLRLVFANGETTGENPAFKPSELG